MEFNLAEVQEAVGELVGERTALAAGHRRVSWTELTERTRRLANALLGRGVGCQVERAALADHEVGQDRVAICMLNGPEYLEAMLGAFKARAAPCNVNYRYVADEMAGLFGDMTPAVVVYHAQFGPVLTEALSRINQSPLLVEVEDGSGSEHRPGAVRYEDLLASASGERPDVPWSPDDLYVLYTGGTTGMPKGVLWRQADVFVTALGGRNYKDGAREWRSLEELVEAVGTRQGVRSLSAAPLMHGTAQWVSFQALHTGGTVVFPKVVDHLDADDVLDTVEAEHVDLLTIAGEAFARPVLEALARSPRDLSSLSVLATSGAALSPASRRALLEFLPTVRIRDTVGSSESGPLVEIVDRGTPGSGEPTAESRPVAFRPAAGTIVLDEDQRRALPPGHEGTGWLARSGRLPLGYLGDPKKTAATFKRIAGIRVTIPGDRARLLSDGSIEVLGRDSVTINSGGEKIFAEEVEAAIRQHPAVRDVIVVGRPSERWGSEVVALVEPEQGLLVDAEGVIETCRLHVAGYKAPKAVIVVEKVMRNPAGKPDYVWARAASNPTT
jgi:acyl-CoA synthetase (AMP-forming)/AMP-acid ligase II